MTRPRSDAAGDVDGEALARELVDDRQTLQRAAIRARVEHEVVGPDMIDPVGGSGRGRLVATRRRGRFFGS